MSQATNSAQYCTTNVGTATARPPGNRDEPRTTAGFAVTVAVSVVTVAAVMVPVVTAAAVFAVATTAVTAHVATRTPDRPTDPPDEDRTVPAAATLAAD